MEAQDIENREIRDLMTEYLNGNERGMRELMTWFLWKRRSNVCQFCPIAASIALQENCVENVKFRECHIPCRQEWE